MKQIKNYGLIPLGADAWLADMEKKHQALTLSPGGIILVHGNSNEPRGIQILTPLLKTLTFRDIKKTI